MLPSDAKDVIRVTSPLTTLSKAVTAAVRLELEKLFIRTLAVLLFPEVVKS